jgi:lipopolysaccharide heptosyltransferase II
LQNKTAGESANGPAIAINPMAKWQTKLWPSERFARLADRLITQYRATVFFTGGPEDQPVIDKIQKSMRSDSVNLAGQTSLMELAALYQDMACVISTDTGPMHIAAAVETPTAALFGPTADWRTGPFGDGHRIVSANPQCRPCFKRSCETTHCMREIRVESVLGHVHDLLTEKGSIR